jgi:hypothetical protein
MSGGPHVVFDPPNTWDVFGGDNECPLLLFGILRRPQMHDAVFDGSSTADSRYVP